MPTIPGVEANKGLCAKQPLDGQWDYDLVSAYNLLDFTTAVRARLNTGWSPLGGVAIDAGGRIYQALMKWQHGKAPQE